MSRFAPIADLLAQDRKGHTLPRELYVSEDAFEFDTQVMLKSVWLYACTVAPVKNPGDFFVFELAQNSVDQVVTQRMMCCRDAKEARKAVLGSLGIVAFSLLMAAVDLKPGRRDSVNQTGSVQNPLAVDRAQFCRTDPVGMGDVDRVDDRLDLAAPVVQEGLQAGRGGGGVGHRALRATVGNWPDADLICRFAKPVRCSNRAGMNKRLIADLASGALTEALAGIAEDAARVILPYWRNGVVAESKADDSPVTRADHEARLAALARAQMAAGDFNQALIAAGRMARVDLVQTEADVAAQEFNVENADNDLNASRLMLLQLLALASLVHF